MLNASQSGFRERHRTTPQCIRLANQVTLKFNNNYLWLRYSTILKKPLALHGTSLNSMAIWCERWNMKINEEKTTAIYFSHRITPPDFLLTLMDGIFHL
jgi:hypothetical protein